MADGGGKEKEEEHTCGSGRKKKISLKRGYEGRKDLKVWGVKRATAVVVLGE